jgi:hypothetical protein
MNDRDDAPKVVSLLWSTIVILLAAVLSIAGSVWIAAYQAGIRVVVVTNVIAVIVGATAATYVYELSRRIYKRESEMEALITSSAKEMADRQDAISRALGIPARLIPDSYRGGRGDYYRIICDAIATTTGGEPIITITSHFWQPIERAPVAQQERNRYFDMLETKARSRDAFVDRILCYATQVDPAAIPIHQMRHDFVEHLLRLQRIHDDDDGTACLRLAGHFLPADIMVIGNRFAALTVDVYERKGQTNHAIEVLCWIFHNPPNADVIEHLKRWCKEVETRATPIGGFDRSTQTGSAHGLE